MAGTYNGNTCGGACSTATHGLSASMHVLQCGGPPVDGGDPGGRTGGHPGGRRTGGRYATGGHACLRYEDAEGAQT
jgi:hypothetical protein